MKYDPGKIEPKWQKQWLTEGTYEPDLKNAKKPFYNLMMFPYPSAEGLHVGNMYAFAGSDIYGRFKRMQGYDVFEPIGLDGFGIHSENYAIKTGKHPAEQAKVTEKNFYRQLYEIGNGFAWNEKLETYDPDYYKWTQWIFIQLFKHGLAYRKKQPVNWCPSCLTVLADEQVIAGKCERCGTAVIKKDLEQWFFKITDYAERLLNDLDGLDWSEKIKVAQKNWIGKSEGAMIKFSLVGVPGQPDGKHSVEVFTTRPDTLFGATYLAISPELAKQWLDVGWKVSQEIAGYVKKTLAEREKSKDEVPEKTGVFSGIYAINPANQEKIPVWIADYVLAGYGTGAIMAVPAHDERDFEFAKKFELPVRVVIQDTEKKEAGGGVYVGEGKLVNSGKFNNADSEKAKWEITKFVKGEKKIQYRLRDWLISRQRYWGPPIPMIYCEACAKQGEGERKEMPGWYAAPEKDLPVLLPVVKDFRPKGKGTSPLAEAKEFYEVKCPGCGEMARRETDVSDTFLDSAWYYLRYPSVGEKNAPWSKGTTKQWLPVNMYIGGAEHAVLHLLYVRFIAKAFHDLGFLHFDEPAKKFRAHGLLIREGAKISKSKGNIINPDDFIKKFGADAFRMHLMFLAPFEDGGDFRDEAILGPVRFLERAWKFGEGVLKEKKTENNPELDYAVHAAIKKITEDVEDLRYNTAVSALMILLGQCEKAQLISVGQFGIFLRLLAPFAPHITEELWQNLGNKTSIHKEKWPEYDPALIKQNTFTLVIQVNGKMRDSIEAPIGIKENDAKELALRQEKIKTTVGNSKIKKMIFVPDRLVNLVI